MVCLENQLIGGSKDQMKQKTQDGQKVFNLAVSKIIETALEEIFIF